MKIAKKAEPAIPTAAEHARDQLCGHACGHLDAAKLTLKRLRQTAHNAGLDAREVDPKTTNRQAYAALLGDDAIEAAKFYSALIAFVKALDPLEITPDL